MQIVGDKDLYGKDYVIEPKAPAPAATPNPGYQVLNLPWPRLLPCGNSCSPGNHSRTAPATTTVVVVEQAPIVQYVYSPVYVPYYPPYHYACLSALFCSFCSSGGRCLSS